MQFGIYLLEHGRITADQLVQAMQAQLASRPPLGQMAIEQGRLSVRDVLRVLRVQSDLPEDRFGDTAIELGLLTRRDVAELLLLQSDRQLPLDRVLINTGALDYPTCQAELTRFRESLEQASAFGDRAIRRIRCTAPTPEPVNALDSEPAPVGATASDQSLR